MRKLLLVLNGLVDKGNTVIVIEHNLDVIKSSDWIIDMGPEGGSGGGSIIATGTPETVARSKKSHTGQFLKEVLASSTSARKKTDAAVRGVSPATARRARELAS